MDICTLPPDLLVGQEYTAKQDLWHLPRNVWDVIWSRNVTGQGVKYGNIDTGYNPDHPDIPNAANTSSYIRGESVMDGNGHGTHTIGTAIGRNGIGVAPGAELHFVGKVLSNKGSGSSDGIAKGIRDAADLGCDVVSASLGGGDGYEPTRRAIEYLNSKGGVFIAAAGNAGFNGGNTIGYPAKWFEALCVGATRQDGNIANFSSGGREIDVACPGQDIISASHKGSGYVSMSGTSMSTPFFAGLVCLIIQLHRREGHGHISGVDAWREFLSKFSEDRGKPGKDDRFGYGVPMYDLIVDHLDADDIVTMSI